MEALYEELQALENDSVGDFVCSGCLKELPFPGLFIKKVGDIALPVQEEQVKKIITVAKKAPFGLGEKTVVDESVRKSWQLDPKQIIIKNNLFNQGVKKVVATVKDQLGCNKKAVKAYLYKVLLYETGGHFKAHRDTEKEKGMFATLIIQLPSAFEGGKLVVRHGGKEKEVKFDGEESLYLCKYAAHYSDCEHEITEIQKGYRLALVYSLCWTATGHAAPSADANAVVVQNVARILPTVCTEERKMFSWFLTHKYTSAGLAGSGVKALKGHDAEVVKALQMANELLAEEQRFDLYITMVTRQLFQNGDYSYGDCEFECCDEEEEVSIKNEWYNLNGATIQMMASVHVNIEEEVVNYRCPSNMTSEAYKNKFWGEADEQEDSGPTGNEGATQTYWYRSYAIFAWPKVNAVHIMCESGISATVDWLANEFAQVKALPASHPSYQKAMAHLKYVLNFAISKPILMYGENRAVCSMLTILADLHTDAAELANLFLIDVMAKEVSWGNTKSCYCLRDDAVIASLVHLAVIVGWQSISEAILRMFQLSPASQYGRWAVFLRELLEKMNENKNKVVGKNKCFKSILVSLVDAVEAGALGKTLNSTDAITWVSKTAPLLFLVNDTELLNKWTNAVLLQSPNSSLLEKLIETLSTEGLLVGASQFWLKLLQSRIDQLEKAVEQKDQPFSWKQNAAVIVGHSRVQTFLRGPTQTLKYQAFSGIGHARNWANKHFCQNRWYSSTSSSYTYSANVTTAGVGSKSYALIEKTRDWYDKKMAMINRQMQDLSKLQAMVNTITCTNKDLTTEDLEPAAKKRALSTICVD